MNKVVKIDYLSRVEGEGGVVIEIKDNKINKIQLKIFEAPRFFESFLIGRSYQNVIDFTARICGICPVAYQMSAVHAIEEIFGITVENSISELRRLLYTGEWIESHALHIYLLNGPDFYGIPNAWADRNYLELAKVGLRLKKAGNNILAVLGGRPVHPISVRVGGFYKTPRKKELEALLPELQRAYEDSLNTIKWASSLSFNDNILDTEYVSLCHETEYPINRGKVLSNKGIDLSMDKFNSIIQEYQVKYSTALYSGIKRDSSVSPYFVGPIARLNLNHDKLPDEIKALMNECGIVTPLKNSHMGIIARAVELAYAIYEAMQIITKYEEPIKPYINYSPQPGEATWITEAPRGILIHKYKLDEKGNVKGCAIIPPTSQNLGHIEKDIYNFLQNNIDKSPDFLKRECEKIIRSYDPCISCAVHVLVVK